MRKRYGICSPFGISPRDFSSQLPERKRAARPARVRALFTRPRVTLPLTRGKSERRRVARLHGAVCVCVCARAHPRILHFHHPSVRAAGSAGRAGGRRGGEDAHVSARARERAATAAASSIHAYTRSQTDSRLESNILK